MPVTLINNELITTSVEYRREGNAFWIIGDKLIVKVWMGNINSWTEDDKEYFNMNYNHAMKCEVAGFSEVMIVLKYTIGVYQSLTDHL